MTMYNPLNWIELCKPGWEGHKQGFDSEALLSLGRAQIPQVSVNFQ